MDTVQSVNNVLSIPYLSLDHIKTGTGKEESAHKHPKNEIKTLHSQRDDEAAILPVSLKARDFISSSHFR